MPAGQQPRKQFVTNGKKDSSYPHDCQCVSKGEETESAARGGGSAHRVGYGWHLSGEEAARGRSKSASSVHADCVAAQ